jgi:hypothetical protein
MMTHRSAQKGPYWHRQQQRARASSPSELKVDDAKVKNFWRGWKLKVDSNRGAPRKNGDGVDLVRRLLGGKRSKYLPGFEPPKNG